MVKTNKYKKLPAPDAEVGGYLVGKENGKVIAHNDGNKGGYLVGRRHSEQGGIKAINTASDTPILVESTEVQIAPAAVNDNSTTHSFDGKEGLTNKEVLSEINTSGGGVPIAERGAVIEDHRTDEPIALPSASVIITSPAVASSELKDFDGKQMTNIQILSAINESNGGCAFDDLPEQVYTSGKKYSVGGVMTPDYEIVESCGCKHLMKLGGESLDFNSPEYREIIRANSKRKDTYAESDEAKNKLSEFKNELLAQNTVSALNDKYNDIVVSEDFNDMPVMWQSEFDDYMDELETLLLEKDNKSKSLVLKEFKKQKNKHDNAADAIVAVSKNTGVPHDVVFSYVLGAGLIRWHRAKLLYSDTMAAGGQVGQKLTLLHNKEKAPNMGSRFGQDVEPSGYYAIEKHGSFGDDLPNYETVEFTAEKPLIINVTPETLVSWKHDLSKQYKAKKKKLSEKLKKEGYDIIITKYPEGDTGEIIVLDTDKIVSHKKYEDGGQVFDINELEKLHDKISKEIGNSDFYLDFIKKDNVGSGNYIHFGVQQGGYLYKVATNNYDENNNEEYLSVLAKLSAAIREHNLIFVIMDKDGDYKTHYNNKKVAINNDLRFFAKGGQVSSDVKVYSHEEVTSNEKMAHSAARDGMIPIFEKGEKKAYGWIVTPDWIQRPIGNVKAVKNKNGTINIVRGKEYYADGGSVEQDVDTIELGPIPSEEEINELALTHSEPLRIELSLLNNKRNILVAALLAFNNFTELRSKVISELILVSEKRYAIPRREALRAQADEMNDLVKQYESDPEALLAAINEYKKNRYDVKTDVENKYSGTNYITASDEQIFNDVKKFSEILESLTESDAIEYGEVYNSRYDIQADFAMFKKEYLSIKRIEHKELEPMGISFNTLESEISKLDADISNITMKLSEIEDTRTSAIESVERQRLSDQQHHDDVYNFLDTQREEHEAIAAKKGMMVIESVSEIECDDEGLYCDEKMDRKVYEMDMEHKLNKATLQTT